VTAIVSLHVAALALSFPSAGFASNPQWSATKNAKKGKKISG